MHRAGSVLEALDPFRQPLAAAVHGPDLDQALRGRVDAIETRHDHHRVILQSRKVGDHPLEPAVNSGSTFAISSIPRTGALSISPRTHRWP